MNERSLHDKIQDGILLASIKTDELTAALSEGYADEISLRLLIKAFPLLGPVLDTVLSEPGQRARRQRIGMFLEELRDELAAIDDSKVDAEFLTTPEFEGIVEAILRRVAVTSRADKLRILRSALLGSMSPKYSGSPTLDSFLSAVDVLSPDHVRLLANVAAVGGMFSSQPREIHDEDPDAKLQFQSLKAEDQTQLEMVFDLTARGFMAYEPTEGAVLGIGKSNVYVVTILGHQFLGFLKSRDDWARDDESGVGEKA